MMIASEIELERPLIFELPAVFTAAECDRWIRRIQLAGTELATINTKRGSQLESQIRNNRRVIFDDPEWAHELFERVKDQVPQEIHQMSLDTEFTGMQTHPALDLSIGQKNRC